MLDWEPGEVRPLPLDALGERYRRFRLPDAEAETAMTRSLLRYGQIAPLVVCLREERPEILDGFKRLAAARTLPQVKTLSVRLLAADERTAKAAIYGLNHSTRSTRELEEAWIVFALVREDGLTQPEAAALLGRHKSWVCRRLALLEKLDPEVQQDLRLGLLPASWARQLTRLPVGNQLPVLQAARREGLDGVEVHGLVDLLLGAYSREKEEFLLAQPRRALAEVNRLTTPPWDPRLSVAGNHFSKQLARLLEQLARMEAWLTQRSRAELRGCDRLALQGGLQRLSRDSRSVADLAAELLAEVVQP
jgi:ParB-like chromosome segregation protein Spo0J